MVSFSLGIVIGIIAGIILILIAILTILLRKEKGLQQQLVKVEEKSKYLKRIDELMKSDKSGELVLNALDQLSKEYFEDKYNVNKETDYSEIRAEMLKRGEKEAAEFAQEMVRALYSGRKMKMAFLQENMKKFRELIQPSPLPKENTLAEDKKELPEINLEYENIKNIKTHSKLPSAELNTPAQTEKTLKLLKGAKETGEVLFPVINKTAQSQEEDKEEQIKEKQKEKEWRSAFRKESLAKELPVKLQEQIKEEDKEIDAGGITNRIESPQKPSEQDEKISKKEEKKQLLRKIANVPSSLYSHLR